MDVHGLEKGCIQKCSKISLSYGSRKFAKEPRSVRCWVQRICLFKLAGFLASKRTEHSNTMPWCQIRSHLPWFPILPWWYYVNIHHVRVSPTASNGIGGAILSKPKHPSRTVARLISSTSEAPSTQGTFQKKCWWWLLTLRYWYMRYVYIYV